MSNVTTLLKSSLKTSTAKALYFDIISNISNYYYAFGRSNAWPTVTTTNPDSNISELVSDELTPPSASDTYGYELETRRDLQYFKLIDSSDAALVVPRYDWTVGTIYDQYDDYNEDRRTRSGQTQLQFAKFYVLTDEFNVYKCLFNNNGAPSAIKPTGTLPQAFTTLDGYVWKFMYTIPISLKNKFLQPKFMPISTALTDQFYGNGSIRRFRILNKGKGYIRHTWRVKTVRVINGGQGYTVAGTILAFDVPPTGGTQATAVVESVGTEGNIISVRVTNKGAGYNVLPQLKIISAPTGANGAEFFVEYEKTFTSGYTDVKITGDGFNELNPYSIKTVSIVNRGTFDEIPQDEDFFAWPSPAAGYGQFPDVTVTFRVKAGTQPVKYEINTVTLNFGGFGYQSPLIYNTGLPGANVFAPVLLAGGAVLDFNTDTQKNEAKAVALIVNGEIRAIQVTEQGIGYSFATVEVEGYKRFTINGTSTLGEMSDDPNNVFFDPNFKKAEVLIDFNFGNVDSKQSDVELLAVDGSIEVINVDEGGTGFSSATVLTVVGDGVGCTCVPVTAAGQLQKIIVTNPGRGYTFANVIVSGGGTNAKIRPIISPKGGHGKDVFEELYATTVFFATKLSNEKNQGFRITNDFRQICIIKDLAKYKDDTFFTSSLGSSCAVIKIARNSVSDSAVSGIAQDTVLFLSNDTSRFIKVIEKITTATQHELLISLETNYMPGIGDQFERNNTSSKISVDQVEFPTVDKYSGQLLYIDNRTKFVSNAEQTVVINTIINL